MLAERLPNSDMGFRLKNSGVLYLRNLVDRLERFCSESPRTRNKLESEVTLDRMEFYAILCGSSDGYDHAQRFLKIFQPDEEKMKAENEHFAALKEAREEIDDVIRSNQSLTMKVQDCYNQIDQQDAMIKKLEQDIRDITAEREREKQDAAFRLQHELEALAGRHNTEREALMTVITLADTLRLQIESELMCHATMHQAYKERSDAVEEMLRENVRMLEDEVEDWKRKYLEIKELYEESAQRIESLERAAVLANTKHAQQARSLLLHSVLHARACARVRACLCVQRLYGARRLALPSCAVQHSPSRVAWPPQASAVGVGPARRRRPAPLHALHAHALFSRPRAQAEPAPAPHPG
jgi:hypothetical protein